MNDQSTSASGASLLPDSTSIITGTHLVFMAVFAVLVVLGILWGMRLKRRRDAADREIAQDNRDIETTDRDPRAGDAARAAPTAAAGPSSRAGAEPPLADDPNAAAAPLDANPAVAAHVEGAAPATEAVPVTRLKGLGPKVAARLAELGITDAAQLAALDDAGAAALDAELGPFAGRMARDRWIEQARFLASGDKGGFEAAFGKL